jgi:hypothetical protein
VETTHSAQDARASFSLSAIDLRPCDASKSAAFQSILRSKLLTTLISNDVSGKVNARGLNGSGR